MEEVRGLAYEKVQQGLETDSLATDPYAVTGCTGDPAGTYRFESCSGEAIVHTDLEPDQTVVPLMPNNGTLDADDGYPTPYTWRVYVTNDDPTRDPYRVTVIVTWSSRRITGAANEVRIQSLFYSPAGCQSTTTHPFAAPCQPFFFGIGHSSQQAVSITGTIPGIAGFEEAELLGPVVNEPSGLPPNTQGVVVSVTRTPRTFFLGVVGQTSWNVGAGATALAGRLTGAPGGILLPIGTNPPQPFEPGREYVLTETGSQQGGGSSPDFGPGNFGWLSWTGSNAAGALAAAICNPNNPAFSFPADFPGDPGATNANDVRNCLDKWIGQTVLIPVVSGCDPCNGNNAVFTIVGAAAFTLTGYDGNGPAVSWLSGVFSEYYGLPSVSAGIGGPPQPGDPQLFLGLIR